MTFEQLDYLIAAVQYDTFLEAAEHLNISQSTLSKQIRRLEEELELPLFDRSRRSASLTQAGEVFYAEAQRLSRQYREMLSRIEALRETGRTELRIAAPPILSQYQISCLLKDFAGQNPDITLRVEETGELELLERLERSESDIIIVRKHMLDMQRHVFYPLAEDRLVVLLPADHPLACRRTVSLLEVARERFILMPPDTSLHQLCIRLFQEAGVTPDILRTARLETILGEVAIHSAISLSAEENLRIFQEPHVTAVPLDPSPKLLIGAAYRKGKKLSHAASAFLGYLRRVQPCGA